MITQAIRLVNAHSRNAGYQNIDIDPDRIVRVIDIHRSLHPDVRALHEHAYEVRFDARYPYISLVIIGPDGLVNHLKDKLKLQDASFQK